MCFCLGVKGRKQKGNSEPELIGEHLISASFISIIAWFCNPGVPNSRAADWYWSVTC